VPQTGVEDTQRRGARGRNTPAYSPGFEIPIEHLELMAITRDENGIRNQESTQMRK